MSFSYVPARKVSPEESSPWNNLLSNAMKNYQSTVNAKYANREKEADIFNKTVSPLAQFAVSPMGMALAPHQQEMFKQYMSQALQGLQNGQNSGGSGSQEGLSGWIAHKLGFGNPSANTNMPQQSDNNTPENATENVDENGNPIANERNNSEVPLFPGQNKDLGGKVSAGAIQPLQSSNIKENQFYQNPNDKNVRLPQSGGNLARIQGDINSQEEIKILSTDLTDHYKNMSGSLISKISRGLSRAGITDPKEAEQYRAFRDEQLALKSSLKAAGVSEHDAEETVKLHLGEKNYADRIKKQTARAIAKINRDKKRLSGGTIVNTKEEGDYAEGVDQNEVNPDSYTTDELLEMRKAILANSKRR